MNDDRSSAPMRHKTERFSSSQSGKAASLRKWVVLLHLHRLNIALVSTHLKRDDNTSSLEIGADFPFDR
jgi:hypothetical protein